LRFPSAPSGQCPQHDLLHSCRTVPRHRDAPPAIFSGGALARFDRVPGVLKYTVTVARARWRVQYMSEAMSEVSSERAVIITDSAARRIAALKAQEAAENAFLRIAVSGGGCSGFQYGLSFDDQRNPDDFVFEQDGVAVIVDDVSLDLLNGAEVDFVEDMMGASFQIKNPNAASSCGCGNSFSVAI